MMYYTVVPVSPFLPCGSRQFLYLVVLDNMRSILSFIRFDKPFVF